MVSTCNPGPREYLSLAEVDGFAERRLRFVKRYGGRWRLKNRFQGEDESLLESLTLFLDQLRVRIGCLRLRTQVAQRAGLLSGGRLVSTDHNEFGAIAFEPESHPPLSGKANLLASTQLFENGEIWSLSSALTFRERQDGRPAWLRYPHIPSLKFEQVYYDCLRCNIAVAEKELGFKDHVWQVELGIVGIVELWIAINTNSFDNFWGPIRVPEVIHRKILNDAATTTLDELLLEFFNRVYDAAGRARPSGSFGFPPNRPAGAALRSVDLTRLT